MSTFPLRIGTPDGLLFEGEKSGDVLLYHNLGVVKIRWCRARR